MRPKTITLCPTTHEIARKIPNFSKWIREQLLNYKDTPQAKRKKLKTVRCSECYEFVDATWELFMDGTEGWFGHCKTCNIDKSWIPRR